MDSSRLLRRLLFVAAIAVAGWLLSVVFAATAGADEAPDGHQPQKTGNGRGLGGLVSGLTGDLTDSLSGGLTDSLSGGLTDVLGRAPSTVSGITDSLVGISGHAYHANPAQDEAPGGDLPAPLPDPAPGDAGTDLDPSPPDPSPDDRAAIAAPTTPAVTPQPPAFGTPDLPQPAVATAVMPQAPAPPAAQDPGSVGSGQAGRDHPDPEPVRTPTAPANSGTTVSSSHDGSGGVRSTHGVLPAQTTFHPADAGFGTRSRAVNAAGRVAGLPASSPD